jgi:hypothetical protein
MSTNNTIVPTKYSSKLSNICTKLDDKYIFHTVIPALAFGSIIYYLYKLRRRTLSYKNVSIKPLEIKNHYVKFETDENDLMT